MATFDQAALSKLTTKIDSKLAQSQTKAGGSGNRKEYGKKKRKQSSDQGSHSADAPVNKRSRYERKRWNDEGNPTTPKTASSGTTKNSSGVDIDVLLGEIKALGGSEEDLKLIENIESDDDGVFDERNDVSATGNGADGKLRAELARFAAGLGFEELAPDFAATESEPEVQGGESQAEDDDDVEGHSNNESDLADQPVASSSSNLDAKTRGPSKGKTIFEPRPDWHAVSLKSLPTPSSDEVASYMAAIAALKAHAKLILHEDSVAYSTTLSSSSSRKFISTIMSSGTLSDRVSALTLAIQESPVHNVKALDVLIGFASKRSRGQALSALAALVDLLGPGMILPPDRRLRPFSSQLGLIGTLQKHQVKSWTERQKLPGNITKKHLIAWEFEDWLKDAYFKMIQSLEIWCNDEVEYARTKAVDLVFALLRDKPEQESNLLRLLVNKLGDRQRNIASRASYLLLQLLNLHPGMKTVVIRTVEQEGLLRPVQNVRAKYYAINTLNQTILSSKEPEISESLLRIYFNIFVSLLKNGELKQFDGPSSQDTEGGNRVRKRNEAGKPAKRNKNMKEGVSRDHEATEKLVSAVLTGINRALPFSQADQSTIESHLNTLFRITHSSNFNTSIQALMLIQQLSMSRLIATERFYRTLYESLLDPRLATSSKQALYLNLLYRSLKGDVDVRRVKAFVKRMLQVLNLHQPSFVCGIIYLVIELSTVFADLRTLLTEPEEIDLDESLPEIGMTGTLPEGKDAHAQPMRTSSIIFTPLWTYKFVYRNAKAADLVRGISIMQPVAAAGQGNILVSSKSSVKDGASLNTSSFWNKRSQEVAEDEVFFHEYFAQVGKPRQAERTRTRKSELAEEVSGGEDAGDDEDDIWKALVSSHPEVQGDSESDPEFDDLTSSDDSEDNTNADIEGLGGPHDSDEDGSLNSLHESDFSSDELDEAGMDTGLKAVLGEADGKNAGSQQGARRKALRNLPTFASADDYADMLAEEEEL
ncbi:hypothetical protein DL764_002136 [Monosporascus ibericus]|uniref:CCAAT-binding factor domain-containing protein n=1 Tax=Monosporascus ibericus TaxID=155417 RepID=A0A4V1XC04_9PEZI|nr:hypothetical protein DL764_002136 [Monosporascus ibericus]